MWTTTAGLPLGTRTHTYGRRAAGVGLKAPDICSLWARRFPKSV